MDIRLLQIYYKNIREMKELEVNLCDTPDSMEPYPASLIQMPNGVGKTTTMELIRYCLDGTGKNLEEKKILSFRPPDSKADKGEFKIKLSMGNETIVIGIIFDYEKVSAEYITIKTSKRGGGKERGWNIPREIKSVMSENFVRLFVFDGELAEELLNPDMTSAEEAISSLYHLDKIKILYSKIEDILEEKLKAAEKSGVKTGQGRKALITKLHNAREIKEGLEEEIKKFQTEKATLERKVKSNEEKIRKSIEENEGIRKEYTELTNKREHIRGEIKRNSELLLNKIRFPNNLSDDIAKRLNLLAKRMIKLKLPRTQSTEFFRELAEGEECICGRPIKPEHKKKIISKSKGYLTEDNIGVINAIKTSLRSLPEREKIENVIEDGKKLNKTKQEIEQDISRLEQERSKRGLDDLDKMRERIEQDKKRVEEINGYLQILTESDSIEQESLGLRWKDNLPLCKKEIGKLENELAEATDTVKFKKKVELLKEILDDINKKALVNLKDYLIDKTNKRIVKILNREDIQISKISRCLNIKDREGVSVGQSLSIAYAFLSTLFNESPHGLPFIVDTPASPLDLSVRREVAEIIPPLFPQFVVFLTSGEREGFADRFYLKPKDCQFLTIRKDLDPDGVKLESSINHFKQFQSED